MSVQDVVVPDRQIDVGSGEESLEVASAIHGGIAVVLSSHLYNYVRPRKLGRVLDGRTTFEIGLNQPYKEPDVSFVTLDRLPTLTDDRVPLAPDLAVEIISATDDWKNIVTKTSQYLQVGVRLVWVVDPYTESVFIFRPATGLVFQTVRDNDELDGEDVIPGFKLAVKTLFEQ